MDTWTELPDEHFDNAEYRNVERGWRNTETDAEVLIYRVNGTGMEEVTDKDWAVQHPIMDEENVQFFDNDGAAEEFAIEYMENHETPPNAY